MAVWTLQVGGIEVFTSRVGDDGFPPVRYEGMELVSLERGYDGPSVLRFRVTGDWRWQRFGADAVVRLLHDGTIIFEGLLDLPTRSAAVGEMPRVEYSARDRCYAAGLRPATALSGSLAWPVTQGTLAVSAAAAFAEMNTQIGALGLSATPQFAGGAGAIQCLPTLADNDSVDSLVRKLAAATPGVRVFLHPNGGTPAYLFVRVFGADPYLLDVDETRTESIQVSQSLDGRCGAVRTNERQENTSVDTAVTAVLTAAWDSGEEANWTLRDSHTLPTDGAETARSKVFRLFSFDAVSEEMSAAGKFICEVEDTTVSPAVWRPVEIKTINWEDEEVLLKWPALKNLKPRKPVRRNPNVPGTENVAARVRVRYSQELPGVTTVPGVRFPANGFTGTAYAMAPTTMATVKEIVLPEMEGGNDAKLAYLLGAFEAMSQPLTEGTVTLLGEPPEELLLLSRRVSIIASRSGQTGLEQMRAPLVGYTLDFSGGFRMTLDFSIDRMSLLRDAQA